MTRDFEIIFKKESDLFDAVRILKSVKTLKDGLPIFGEIEIRKKTISLFVTMTYPHEIMKEDIIITSGNRLEFYKEVVFVAIKNGMHDTKGYVFLSKNINIETDKKIHIKKLHDLIMRCFI